jgi:hypothetical protein
MDQPFKTYKTIKHYHDPGDLHELSTAGAGLALVECAVFYDGPMALFPSPRFGRFGERGWG